MALDALKRVTIWLRQMLESRSTSVRGFALWLGLFSALPLTADDRSIEILRYGCGSEFGRRDITLFKNGTLRVFEGPWNDQHMYLTEIGPDAVETNIRVLAEALALADVERLKPPVLPGAHGRWMEHCRLNVSLPDASPFEYEMSALDIVPLRVARLVAITEELLEHFPPPSVEAGIAESYKPRGGDVLRTDDGALFRVKRLTADRLAVELEGIDQPLTVYVPLNELAMTFEELVKEGKGQPLPDSEMLVVPSGGGG